MGELGAGGRVGVCRCLWAGGGGTVFVVGVLELAGDCRSR